MVAKHRKFIYNKKTSYFYNSEGTVYFNSSKELLYSSKVLKLLTKYNKNIVELHEVETHEEKYYTNSISYTWNGGWQFITPQYYSAKIYKAPIKSTTSLPKSDFLKSKIYGKTRSQALKQGIPVK